MEKMTKREKIMLGVSIGVGVVATGAAGYFGVKYVNTQKQLFEMAKNEGNIKEELNFLKFLIIESGCIPRAQQNGRNKLAREESKIQGIVDAIAKRPNDTSLIESLAMHEEEAKILTDQLVKTDQLAEWIEKGECIYAK